MVAISPYWYYYFSIPIYKWYTIESFNKKEESIIMWYGGDYNPCLLYTSFFLFLFFVDLHSHHVNGYLLFDLAHSACKLCERPFQIAGHGYGVLDGIIIHHT